MADVQAPARIVLRHVEPADLAVFYEHQSDPEATTMADFPGRDEAAHTAHWAKLLANPDVVTMTIEVDGDVVGNVVGWREAGLRKIGYWLGKRHWGRGIATAAVAQFLEVMTERPVFAHVATHNIGSIRVLEKCGFIEVSEMIPTEDNELAMVLPA